MTIVSTVVYLRFILGYADCNIIHSHFTRLARGSKRQLFCRHSICFILNGEISHLSMFFNLTYFDLLFLFLEILLDDLDPLDEPCMVDCCATRAEFSLGFLVEVPKT